MTKKVRRPTHPALVLSRRKSLYNSNPRLDLALSLFQDLGLNKDSQETQTNHTQIDDDVNDLQIKKT